MGQVLSGRRLGRFFLAFSADFGWVVGWWVVAGGRGGCGGWVFKKRVGGFSPGKIAPQGSPSESMSRPPIADFSIPALQTAGRQQIVFFCLQEQPVLGPPYSPAWGWGVVRLPHTPSRGPGLGGSPSSPTSRGASRGPHTWRRCHRGRCARRSQAKCSADVSP